MVWMGYGEVDDTATEGQAAGMYRAHPATGSLAEQPGIGQGSKLLPTSS